MISAKLDESVQAALNEVREGIDTHHKEWLEVVGRSNACEPQLPRR